MANKKDDVVDLRWLAEGKEDPHKDYQTRKRESLPMAHFSDDELANYAFMHYDRSATEEIEAMVVAHQNADLGNFHSKIGFMTAVKERIRWLSRQLAIAEGRIPLADPSSEEPEKGWVKTEDGGLVCDASAVGGGIAAVKPTAEGWYECSLTTPSNRFSILMKVPEGS